MYNNAKKEQMFGGWVEMDEEKYSLKEAIELYFGEPRLTEEEERQIDERLLRVSTGSQENTKPATTVLRSPAIS